MGENDNRRTFKMKRRKAQSAKKARLKLRIQASLEQKKASSKR